MRRHSLLIPGAPGRTRLPLVGLLPLLKALRRLVDREPAAATPATSSCPPKRRPSNPATPKASTTASPPLKDLDDLKDRVEAAHGELSATNADLADYLPAPVKPLYDALQADPDRVIDAQWAMVFPSCAGGWSRSGVSAWPRPSPPPGST